MQYPTLEEVEAADLRQICEWHRFLESPGRSAITAKAEVFYKAMFAEAAVLKRISERLKELGGFTPEISKAIGWHRR